jgi:hypothetical protein
MTRAGKPALRLSVTAGFIFWLDLAGRLVGAKKVVLPGFTRFDRRLVDLAGCEGDMPIVGP